MVRKLLKNKKTERLILTPGTKVWQDDNGLWRDTIFGEFDFKESELSKPEEEIEKKKKNLD